MLRELESDSGPLGVSSGLAALLASGGAGSHSSRYQAAAQAFAKFDLSAFEVQHADAVGAMLCPAFGLRDLVRVRGDEDDPGAVFNPRYTDSTEAEDSSDDNDHHNEVAESDGRPEGQGGSATTGLLAGHAPKSPKKQKEKKKKLRSSYRRIVVSKAMPCSSSRGATELCHALHMAAMLRDVPPAHGEDDAVRWQENISRRQLLAKCMTELIHEKQRALGLPPVTAAIVQCSGSAKSCHRDAAAGACLDDDVGPASVQSRLLPVIVDHLTEPFVSPPSAAAVKDVYETVVAPVVTLLYPVRPTVVFGLLQAHHLAASSILDAERALVRLEMTRWNLMDAWLDGRGNSFFQASVRQLGKRLVRLSLATREDPPVAQLLHFAQHPAVPVAAAPAASLSSGQREMHPALAGAFGSGERLLALAQGVTATETPLTAMSGSLATRVAQLDCFLYWEMIVSSLEASHSSTAAQ